MNATTKETKPKISQKQSTEIKEKSCFIIMPIADNDAYPAGHFKRVYDHIIKPACKKAGYNPIRADDVASSNHIVVDILKKLIESDMVICDLSSRNPNVLYELGLRHAFNKPTVLIKDSVTPDIFDISSIRYQSYDGSLRIDNAQKNINDIAKAIEETERNAGKDINSIVKLIGVSKAEQPESVELDKGQSILLNMMERLQNDINSLTKKDKSSIRRKMSSSGAYLYDINGYWAAIGEDFHITKGGTLLDIGEFTGAGDDFLEFTDRNTMAIRRIYAREREFSLLEPHIPF